MKLLTFPEGKEGIKIVASEITDQDLVGEAQLWRERMLESLYNYSNELMELALAEEPIPGVAHSARCCATPRCICKFSRCCAVRHSTA